MKHRLTATQLGQLTNKYTVQYSFHYTNGKWGRSVTENIKNANIWNEIPLVLTR